MKRRKGEKRSIRKTVYEECKGTEEEEKPQREGGREEEGKWKSRVGVNGSQREEGGV